MDADAPFQNEPDTDWSLPRKTECFGPVRGLMKADRLEQAIAIANDSDFGLTGGLHSLDQREIALWRENIEVGNVYINRSITGAIVQRQPFGGEDNQNIP
jgi:RHH-type proline utilization regulon transcriptional repressor/proline dehydrogenase/delta 1-pyrroline-5-carboxylate dehydrogenase